MTDPDFSECPRLDATARLCGHEIMMIIIIVIAVRQGRARRSVVRNGAADRAGLMG